MQEEIRQVQMKKAGQSRNQPRLSYHDVAHIFPRLPLTFSDPSLPTSQPDGHENNPNNPDISDNSDNNPNNLLLVQHVLTPPFQFDFIFNTFNKTKSISRQIQHENHGNPETSDKNTGADREEKNNENLSLNPESAGKNERNIDELIERNSQKFHERFLNTFPAAMNNYNSSQSDFAKATLSNLLGIEIPLYRLSGLFIG